MPQSIGFNLSGVGAFLSTKLWLLQRTFNWQLLMPHDIGGVVGYKVSQYCQDVEFGDYSIVEISAMRYGAFQRFYAGLQDIDVITLTFLKPIDNSVLDYFYGWFDLVIDKKGYYYPKNHYKKDIYVMLYDRTGIESVKFRLRGTFPVTRPIIRAAYGVEDILRLTVSLRVDLIELHSIIGAVREGVSNFLAPVTSRAKDILGKVF